MIGTNSNTSVMNSFWDTQTSGQSSSQGGVGKSSIDLQGFDVYYNSNYQFKTIHEQSNWNIGHGRNNGYAYLNWQFPDDVYPSDPVKATVQTMNVAGVAPNEANVLGKILFVGTPVATSYGVCWSESEMPDLNSNVMAVNSGIQTGKFSCEITGLSASTSYYARAFVTNSQGTAYGEQVTFTTLAPGSITLCEAVDNCDLLFSTGGYDDWVAQTENSFDGVDVVRSGTIPSYSNSWIETSVEGFGVLSFYWNVLAYWNNQMQFYIDGELQSTRYGSTTSSWDNLTYYLKGGTHTLRWVYQKNSSIVEGSDCGYLDQVVFTPVHCPFPEDLSATDLTTSSALLSWIEMQTADLWDIEWGQIGFVQGNGTIVEDVSSNPYLLEGLSAATMYDFYVRSKCSLTEQSSWVGPFTFMTNCEAMAFPFTCSFDEVNHLPVCWSSNGKKIYSVDVTNHQNHSANNSARLYHADYSEAYLVTPVTETSINLLRLNFKALQGDCPESGKLSVGTMTNPSDPASFKAIHQLEITNSPGEPWQEFSLYFTGYTGSDKYLALRLGSELSSGWSRVFIDDINIGLKPQVPEPTFLESVVMDAYNASMTWRENGSASEWEVKYGIPGFDVEREGFSVVVSSLSCNLSALTPETTYQAYVRSVDGLNVSEWSLPILFTTQPTCLQPSLLTAALIDEQSVRLSWQANGSGTLWDVEYGNYGFTQGSGTFVVGIDVTNYDVLSLDASTEYTFYVRSNCGNGDYSDWSGPYVFATNCGVITAPYSQSFDQASSYSFPMCWYRTGADDYKIDLTMDRYYSSSSSARMYHGDNSYAILATPEIGQMISSIVLNFKALLGNCPEVGKLTVGTMSNPLDESTFVAYQEFDVINRPGQSWHDFTVYFDQYTGTDKHIAFRLGYTGITSWARAFIDDVVLITFPDCIKPLGLSVSEITYTGATLNWEQYGNANLWNVEWGLPGFILGAGNHVSGNRSNQLTLSDLVSGASYEFYVQTQCAVDEFSEWTGPYLFKTNVEGDDCSNAFDLKQLTSPYMGTTSTASNDFSLCNMGSSNDLIFYRDVEHGASIRVWQSFNDFDSRHSMRWGGACPGINEIACVDDDDYEPILWENTTGQTQRVWFVLGGYSFNSGNFTIEWTYVEPMFIQPDDLFVDNQTKTSADLSWREMGNASHWEVEYGVDGFILGTGIAVNDLIVSSCSLSGLSQVTHYQFYVRSVYSDAEKSGWSGPYAFSTLGAGTSVEWENVNEGNVVIFPNPFVDELRILKNDIPVSTRARLFDMTGNQISEFELDGQPLNLSHLSSGVYFVNIDGNSYKIVKR
ncbi:T9SS-dependent choice-of-anchor J family protein [Breznakibacter xylanolyticus]|nr:T9SS type A sorting domain-containing protein [Breznakibacter xylanolyticus]